MANRAEESQRELGRYGWPRLMRLKTAAAYLDMTPGRFLAEVAQGTLPIPRNFGGGERWDRCAIDDALDGGADPDWRSQQPGLTEPLRPAPDVFSVASLAEHWGCSSSRIYSLIHSRELEAFKLGSLFRVKREVVDAYEADLARVGKRPEGTRMQTRHEPTMSRALDREYIRALSRGE